MVMFVCAVADGCHLFATAGDPSCDHQPMVCGSSSSSSLVLGACCTLCAPSVTSSASFTAFYRTAIHRITWCRRVPVSHTRVHRLRRKSLPYCPLPLSEQSFTSDPCAKYILSSDRDLKLHNRYVGYCPLLTGKPPELKFQLIHENGQA